MKAFLFACYFTKKHKDFTYKLGLMSIKIANEREDFDKWFLANYLEKHVKQFDTWDLTFVMEYESKEHALDHFTQITKNKSLCKKYKLGFIRSHE